MNNLEHLNISGIRNKRKKHSPSTYISTCEIECITKPNLASNFDFATQIYGANAFKGLKLCFIFDKPCPIYYSAVNEKHLRNVDFLWKYLSGDIG